MEALVQLHVAEEGLLVLGRVHLHVHALDQRAHRGELTAGHAPLGGEANGRALEHAAQLDRVADVLVLELADRVAATGEQLEQSLMLQRRERETQRSARHAEALDERELRHPRARGELAAENQLPKSQERPRGLRGSVALTAQDLPSRAAYRHESLYARLPSTCTRTCPEAPGSGREGCRLHTAFGL